MRKRMLTSVVIILCIIMAAIVLPTISCAPVQTNAPAPVPSTTAAAPAPTEAIKIHFAVQTPPTDNWAPVINAWVKEFGEKTGGKYKIEMSWGASMGPAAEYYQMLTQDVFGIAWCVPTLTAGRFPITEMLVLPWARPSADIGNKAFLDLYKKGYLDKEYADAKVLFVQAGAGFTLFSVKQINNLADLKGKKIRFSGGPQSDLVTALGAVPVFVASGEIYGAVEKGTVDGAITSYAAIKAFKLQEVLKYAVASPITGSQAFVAVMSKKTYDKMPKDVQAIIDGMLEKYTMMAAKADDGDGAAGEKSFIDSGGKKITWSSDTLGSIDQLVMPIWTKWIADKDKLGIPAKKILDDFYGSLKKYGAEYPAIGYKP